VTDARANQALDLKRAGVPLSRIAKELGFDTLVDASNAIHEALEEVGVLLDPEQSRVLGIDRLDRLLQVHWLKAAKGDGPATGWVLKIEAERNRLIGAPPSTVMVDAYDKTIESLVVTDADTALIAGGHRLAERMDAAAGALDPEAETKAMYLMPHLMNVLRELGATPAARAAVKTAKEDQGGKLSDLRSRRNRPHVQAVEDKGA
jgi:hypothetical protein